MKTEVSWNVIFVGTKYRGFLSDKYNNVQKQPLYFSQKQQPKQCSQTL